MACVDSIPVTEKISFDNLVPGSKVPVYGADQIDLVSLAMLMTGKNRNHSGEAIRNLKGNIIGSEKIHKLKLPGKGNKTTFTARFDDAIEIIMVLPGKMAKQNRQKFADVIKEYFDGNVSLVSEVLPALVAKPAQFDGPILPPIQYVYATKSSAFPGLIKIGKTGNVAKRLSSMNSSCSPSPHKLVAIAQTLDKDRDEKDAHFHFHNARRSGEFFELQESEVINYFQQHITARYHAEYQQMVSALFQCY